MEAGYLGVGAMGQPMAHKLLDAAHILTIYDINEAAMRPLVERQAGAPRHRGTSRIDARLCSCRCRHWPPSGKWRSAPRA